MSKETIGATEEEVRRLHILAERNGIIVAASSTLRILKETGVLPKVQKRRPNRHAPRRRRAQEGVPWQLDATSFAWLGNGHPPFALQAGIDDAPARVVAGAFRPQECMRRVTGERRPNSGGAPSVMPGPGERALPPRRSPAGPSLDHSLFEFL